MYFLYSYFIYAVTFIFLFSLSVLTWFPTSPVAQIFLVFALLSVWPLYRYTIRIPVLVLPRWHVKNNYQVVLHTAFHIGLFACLASVAVFDITEVDGYHALIHLPLTFQLVLFFMVVLLLFSVVLAAFVWKMHVRSAVEGIQDVHINVYRIVQNGSNIDLLKELTTNSELQEELINSGIYLLPNRKANHTALQIAQVIDVGQDLRPD